MPNRPGWLPQIDTRRCTGCGWCVAACDAGLLSLETVDWRKTSVLHDGERCTGCSLCAVRCPFHVITMHKSQPSGSLPVNDDQLLRYSRHLMLDAIGIEGQRRLLASHALIIGAGGLGSPAALYLGTAGVGRITLVDHDSVDVTNLQRQIAHNLARVGQPKAESAAQTLRANNPDLQLQALVQRADAALLDTLLPEVDVVLDCTDNFRTRQMINAACVKHRRPLVSGAAIGFDGQVSVYDSRQGDAPCYACLFPPDAAYEEVACATMGVFAPLVGIIGSVQAAEALKLLTGAGTPLSGRLLMLDGLSMRWDEITLKRQAGCPVCG